MFGQKQKNLFLRGMGLLLGLATCVMMLEEFVFQPDKAVIAWTVLTALVVTGGLFFAMPLAFKEQEPANRWYRAAYLVAWILSVLTGTVCILLAVVWGITGQLPAIGGILLLIATTVGMAGCLVAGGLAAIGYIAQGNEETRQWSRSWGQRNGRARAGSAGDGGSTDSANSRPLL
ncbi:MAG TPA: hypothetical protein VH599_13565 [Ktedonobacterales bacterium]|jgi:hypothetical protein